VRQSLLAVNRRLRALSRTGLYRERYENLISAPGIGCITAMTLLVETVDINRFPNQKKWRSYLGFVPVMQRSDEHEVVGEKTFRGNKHLGPLIIEAAWIAVTKDTELAATYGRHCHNGLKPQEAIVRVAADLAARIYAILKQNKKYVCR
jgi:transposase